jgi:hypothetical protein
LKDSELHEKALPTFVFCAASVTVGSSVAFAACCVSDWFGIFATFAALRLNWEDAGLYRPWYSQNQWLLFDGGNRSEK